MTIPEFYQQLLYGCCRLLRVALQHCSWHHDMYSLCYLLTSRHTRSTCLLPYKL